MWDLILTKGEGSPKSVAGYLPNIGGSCSTYDDEKHTNCWSENMKRRYNSEDLGIDGRIMSDWI
jgi:hypothetical protein